MTDIASLRPALAVAVAAVAVVPILASARRPNLREGWTVLAAVGSFALVASMLPGALDGTVYVADLGTLVAGVEFSLQADPLGLLFATVASLLWLVTSFYSIGYMRGLDEGDQTRYFAAFAASVAAALGVAFAANLVTIFVFYELLTVATYPLVTHDETPEARAAGRKYLAYTFGGGVAVLAGTVLVATMADTTAFAAGGIDALATADPVLARAAFVLLIGGFGVKAALMPLHSWLPDAMVAPTPVSGLLHAVAVVKSGVFGIARVVLDVYGVDLTGALGMGLPLAVVAAATLTLASVIALRQDNLKRRLAFSTVSQLSYIVLGIAILDPTSIVGGLLHIPAHAFMKLTLFFTAGAIHVETHTDDISDMAGIGKRMPLTMLAFGVAAAGMAGIPLVAGFVSKWYLLIGSVSADQAVFAVVLLVSGVLNIAYFWPVFYQAFFEAEDEHDAKPLVEFPLGGESRSILPAEPTPDSGAVTDGGHDGADGHDDHGYDKHDEHGHDDEHDDDHGGPPVGGWERRGWVGGESTWFMLGPILAAMVGAVLIGVVPETAVFLRLVDVIVEGATGVSVL
ncbi:monovalent cation/H+ antiporter subunit D family protein [Haloplanus rallus]|uniref:Monovalent cation/H+ antiporter subunit D family protein n=1 Tax=Haloplanus rallus TaxID=1816183 RepID=A0A6B9F1G1_9EURY|nr:MULTISPECIES: proton-conducting transporter membrane subunit [Haloplanus]QGX94075.1 monovalent cation/H+ antiporter subunit D family protein [Haloplanus rallus]